MRGSAEVLWRFCRDYNVKQLHTIKNGYDNILDLCFTDVNGTTMRLSSDYIFKCDEYHSSFSVNLPVTVKPTSSVTKSFYDFKRADVGKIIIYLISIQCLVLIVSQ